MEEEKSLKEQAEAIMDAVTQEIGEVDEKSLTVPVAETQADTVIDKLFGAINDVDIVAAEERVRVMREKYPDATDQYLVQRLIQIKCQQTGAVGAATSGAGLIPGIGTAATMTLGVAADIGLTFKLQAELVLEIAAVYDYPLTDVEKQRIVMIITGVSTGATTLAYRAGERAALRFSEKFAEKAIIKALPIIGVIASASTNVISTYIIGQRADAYFRLGPEAVGSWTDSLRAITGVDERKITDWLAESTKSTGETISNTVSTMTTTSKDMVSSSLTRATEAVVFGAGTVSGAVVSGAGTVGGAVVSGASMVTSMPRTGFRQVQSYFWPSDPNSEKIVEGEVLSTLDINLSRSIYPYTFTPVFRDYIWGGRNLETILGRDIPDGVIAESWDISGHPSSPTVVDNGALAGKTLPEIQTLLGLNLVGQRSQGMLKRDKFPLLIKLLDANKPLSVQVHPNDEYANEHEDGELGKTEMWYVLHAKPNARLIYGLASEVTPEEFATAIETGNLTQYLHKLPVKAGDAVFIPSGSLHAIMDGIVLTEIQQSADTTYRVYDWNRLGTDGKPRQLHVDKAIQVINFDQIQPNVYQPELVAETESMRQEIITKNPYFQVERFTFERGATFRHYCNGSTFEVWGVMSGAGRVLWTGETLNLSAVRFTLLPATLGDFEIQVTMPGEWLRVFVPN
ncbi:mannose-6-phosphate isomerase, class I [Anaerolineales bacterium HSG6]|nr:mannose-6-phosphate isomerase, class I [Anaerolineales bacterium HSG6]